METKELRFTGNSSNIENTSSDNGINCSLLVSCLMIIYKANGFSNYYIKLCLLVVPRR